MSETAKRCWIFHKWTKWSEVCVPIVLLSRGGFAPQQGKQDMQVRTCERCGRIEREELSL